MNFAHECWERGRRRQTDRADQADRGRRQAAREEAQGESQEAALAAAVHVVDQDDLTRKEDGAAECEKLEKTFTKSNEENAAISEHSSSPTIFHIDQPIKPMIDI